MQMFTHVKVHIISLINFFIIYPSLADDIILIIVFTILT